MSLIGNLIFTEHKKHDEVENVVLCQTTGKGLVETKGLKKQNGKLT